MKKFRWTKEYIRFNVTFPEILLWLKMIEIEADEIKSLSKDSGSSKGEGKKVGLMSIATGRPLKWTPIDKMPEYEDWKKRKGKPKPMQIYTG